MQPYLDDFYRWQIDGSIRSAKEVVPMVLQWIQPESVIDVGCGTGAWLSVFKQYGVEDIIGIDNEFVNPGLLQIPEDKFLTCDLEHPVPLNRRFDLVVSLEVAEHLPIEMGRKFIDFLVTLGPIVLFSAAIPYQGGYNHLNEQWPDFWARYFYKHGYEAIDGLRKRIWDNKQVEWWYAQNLLLFAKRDYIESNPLLKREYMNTHPAQLSVIHPKLYLALRELIGNGKE
jgi:SAM-dependent methyltransferase